MRLQPSGAYCTGDLICAYRLEDKTRKNQFRKDTVALLRAVGKLMLEQGYVKQSVAFNMGGIAVSGDAHAEYLNLSNLQAVYCTINQTFVVGPREDGICIRAVIRQYSDARPRYDGPNHWFSGDLDDEQLARVLIKIMETP